MGALNPGDLPPVLDLEEAIAKSDPLKRDSWNDVPADHRLSIIRDWLDAVEQALGMRPMINTRQNFIMTHLSSGQNPDGHSPSPGKPTKAG